MIHFYKIKYNNYRKLISQKKNMDVLKIDIKYNNGKSPFEENLSKKPIYTKVLITPKKIMKQERTIKLLEEHKKNINNSILNSINNNKSTNLGSNISEQLRKIKRIEKIEKDFRNYLTNQTSKSINKKVYTNNKKHLQENDRIKKMINKVKINNGTFAPKHRYLIKTDFCNNNSVDTQKNNITVENMKSKFSKNKDINDFNIGINIIDNNKLNAKNTPRLKKLNKEKFENLFSRVKNLLNNYQNVVKYYQEKDKLNQNK